MIRHVTTDLETVTCSTGASCQVLYRALSQEFFLVLCTSATQLFLFQLHEWIPLIVLFQACCCSSCEKTKYHQRMDGSITTDAETETVLQGLISKILPGFVHIRNPVGLIPYTYCRYTSDGALAPMAGGHIPENGASGRGYGPRHGPRLGMDPTPAPSGAPPIQKGSGIDTSTNPSPPAPPSADIQSAGPSGTPFNLVFPKNSAGQPSTSPSPPSPASSSSSAGSAASPPATAPGVAAPSVSIPISYSPVESPVSYDSALMMFQQQQQQESLLQQQVKAMADGRGLDDEELLYEAYFH